MVEKSAETLASAEVHSKAPLTYTDAMTFIQNEWQRVWATKSSLEQRAITLITVSGVLVTLAFGFSSAVVKGAHFGNFTLDEKIILDIALGFFALAALIALLSNEPKGYSAPKVDDLVDMPEGSQHMTLERLSGAIEKARFTNEKKAEKLILSLWSELCAIALLAVAVGLVVA